MTTFYLTSQIPIKGLQPLAPKGAALDEKKKVLQSYPGNLLVAPVFRGCMYLLGVVKLD